MNINNPVPPTQTVVISGQPIKTDATVQNASLDTNATVQNFPASQDVVVTGQPSPLSDTANEGDTTGDANNGAVLPVSARLNAYGGGKWYPIQYASPGFDGIATTLLTLLTQGFSYGYNGSTWDRLRTPNVFKSAYATGAGPKTIWTPATGKKFRLMGLEVVASPDIYSASAQSVPLSLTDGSGGSGIFSFVFYMPASSTPSMGQQRFGPFLLGNGYLSTTANNALVAAYTATLSGGYFIFNAWGTEE